MARIVGRAGYGTRRVAVLGFGAPVFMGIVMLPILTAIPLLVRGTVAWTVFIVGLLVDGWFLRKALSETYREAVGSRHWWKGADGEKRVGEELAKLPNEFVVFHDFHWKGADGKNKDWNVDHIVLGPTGVFVIETKNYGTKRIRCAAKDRHTKKNVEQVQRCATELKGKLNTWSSGQLSNVFVEAVLVYAQDGAWVDQTREGAAHVLPLKLLLNDILTRTKQDVTREQVYSIARVLWSQLPVSKRTDFETEWHRIEQDSKAERDQRLRQVREEGRAPSRAATLTSCPYCGAPLVRRIARYGARAGKPFLGCSQYGKTCHQSFGIDLEEASA